MRKYVVNEQQLDEIKWLKNLANKFMEPGRQQNAVGRDQLAKAQERLFGEIQNYLGLRDMSLKDLTPEILAKFLNSYDIAVDPNDIPADPSGIVDRSTIKNIVKDLTIKSLTGEPLQYTNPNASVRQPSVLKPNRTTPQPKTTSPSGSDTSDYLKSWTAKVKSAVDDDAKADLARELAAFLAQKTKSPDGAREVADMLAAQGSSAPASNPAASKAPNPAASVPSTPASSTALTSTSAKQKTANPAQSKKPAAKTSNPAAASTTSTPAAPKKTKSQSSIPTMPSGSNPKASTGSPTSDTAKSIQAGMSALATGGAAAARKRVADLIQQGNPPTITKPEAIASAKSNKDMVLSDNPDGSVKVIGVKDSTTGEWIGASPSANNKQPTKSSDAKPKTTPKSSTTTKSNKKPTAQSKTTATSPSTQTPKPSKPETTTVNKGGNKITLPAMPGSKAESIQKTVKAIKEGKKLNSGLILTAHDYKYFTKILETMNLTLKDLGLWRVLKESSDKYVKLQVR